MIKTNASVLLKTMFAPRNALTSKLFWELIDRWGIADGTALHLLGQASGLTTHGKRPRFC